MSNEIAFIQFRLQFAEKKTGLNRRRVCVVENDTVCKLRAI